MAPTSRSSDGPPTGIVVICLLGALGVVLGAFGSLSLLGTPLAVLGIVLLLVVAVQAVVLWGLWTLQPWAWTAALVVYGIDAVLDLLAGNVVGLFIAVLIAAYIYSKREYYRPEGRTVTY